jgi:uncharacterized protein
MAEAARLLKNAFLHEDCKAIRLYTRKGYDCRAVDSNTDFTLLHQVMRLSCTDCDKSSMAQSLIKAGNPVDARDKDGMTPLMHCRSPALAAVLLDHGADINAKSIQDGSSRFTCLMHAVASDKLPVVQLLLSKGASVDAAVSGYGTALFLACNLGHLAIAKALLAAGACAKTELPLHAAMLCVQGPDAKLELVRLLVQHGADVNEADTEGLTPLMLCVREGAGCHAASVLLEAGADVNARQTGGEDNFVQTTALHYAAYIDAADTTGMLQLLLAAGACADLQCSQGNLPLHDVLRYSGCSDLEVRSSLRVIIYICMMLLMSLLATVTPSECLITSTCNNNRCSRRRSC